MKRKAELAAEAWRSIFDFIVATSAARNAAIGQAGLTPNDARTLVTLSRDTGRTMGSLADEWRCDASTATWIVDRLAAKGLAARRPHPTDRRARLVVLTPLGARTRAAIVKASYAPPKELLELDLEDLKALKDGAARLPIVRPALSDADQST
jgi:DNA-binding MarR family transcriptional regulator